MVAFHRAWCFTALRLTGPRPTGYVLGVYIGNPNFICILLAVEMLAFKGKRVDSTYCTGMRYTD